MAADLGVRYEETLTGFKWIANRAMQLEREGYEVVFGYEEALGYSVGGVVRDKDGISAALLAAEVAAVLAARGSSVRGALDAIARRWGVFASSQVSVTRKGAEGAAAIDAMMNGLRTSPPERIASDVVVAVSDYRTGERLDRIRAARSPLGLPASNVLSFELASGSRIIARPSGTEPKAKFYFDVREAVAAGESVEDARTRARTTLSTLASEPRQGARASARDLTLPGPPLTTQRFPITCALPEASPGSTNRRRSLQDPRKSRRPAGKREKRCVVPKMKTKKAAAKRFRVTGKGRVRRPKAGGNHGMQEKSRKRLRRLRQNDMVHNALEKHIKRLLPYS